jgi:ATP-binding cassette subfamily B protein
MGTSLRGRRRPPNPERPPLRERLAALRYVPPFLKLVWETRPSLAVVMILLRIVRAAMPVSFLWVSKLIVDTVIAMQRDATPDWRRLWTLVAMEVGIVVAGDLLARASSLVDGLLADLFTNRLSVRLMEKSATLDLAFFEDPEFYDKLERARRHTSGRIQMLGQLLAMGQDTLTLVTLAGALIAFNAWLMVLLVVATLPAFLGETYFAALRYSMLWGWTPQRRQLDYARYMGASSETAKEVQIFGLSPWLIDRFRTLSDKFFRENRTLTVRASGANAALNLIGTLGYYGAYVYILARTVQGAITIGTLTFLAASFSRGRDIVQRLLNGASEIHEQSLYLRDLFAFLEIEPTITSTPGAPPVPTPIRQGFVFEDVGFMYPRTERWAVRHLSFSLAPGERLALVGENGAGKTTITKLLARLYDPSEGRILLDGRDLRDHDLLSLRRAIGVIFQDFVRYDMRFDENIGVGEIEEVKGYLGNGASANAVVPSASEGPAPSVPDVLSAAAEKSLASSLLPRLAAGYKQMLGRRFDEGVDLSGGEWQKVALARAYLRDAQVLILDEPTAALDARAEYEVFKRFAELMGGRTAVIVSHRFSTVRMADRIVVLRAGEIVESGTHEELLATGGLYSELFHMQAEGYR